MSNITERTDAPKGFVRRMNPAGRGPFEPSSASASGILATSDIEPLKHNSDAEEWPATSRSTDASTARTDTDDNAAGPMVGGSAAAAATGAATTAASMTTGAAKFAYGTVAGNEQMKKEGSEQIWGKPSQ